MEKKTPLSQIPGLLYKWQALANLPRPAAWDDAKLSAAAKLSVDLKVVGHAVYEPDIPELPEQVLDTLNSKLYDLYKHCEARNVLTAAGLEGAPQQLLHLLQDQQLRPEILRYLQNRRQSQNMR